MPLLWSEAIKNVALAIPLEQYVHKKSQPN